MDWCTVQCATVCTLNPFHITLLGKVLQKFMKMKVW